VTIEEGIGIVCFPSDEKFLNPESYAGWSPETQKIRTSAFIAPGSSSLKVTLKLSELIYSTARVKLDETPGKSGVGGRGMACAFGTMAKRSANLAQDLIGREKSIIGVSSISLGAFTQIGTVKLAA
jgi:hypothetical protein